VKFYQQGFTKKYAYRIFFDFRQAYFFFCAFLLGTIWVCGFLAHMRRGRRMFLTILFLQGGA
jgi:hypothetical protein